MLSFNRMMRLTLVALAAGAFLTVMACSSSSKKKAPEPKRAVTPPTAQPATPSQQTAPSVPSAPAPEDHAPLSGIIPFPAEAGIRTIYFDYDNATIRNDQIAGLDHNLQYLLANPTANVYVEGHCDERGSVEYNLNLGMRRAESIKGFLIRGGVDPSRIISASKGKEQPVDPGHNEAAWSKNRRCEFFQILD